MSWRVSTRRVGRMPRFFVGWLLFIGANGCGSFVQGDAGCDDRAPDDVHADCEYQAGPADARRDAPAVSDDQTDATFQPRFRMVVQSVWDGVAERRATSFSAFFTSSIPIGEGFGSEIQLQSCRVRHNVGWVSQDLGPIRIDTFSGSTSATLLSPEIGYIATVAPRTLPADSPVSVTIPASGGLEAVRITGTFPPPLAPVYPASYSQVVRQRADLSVPVRWQPIDTPYQVRVEIFQSVGSRSTRAECVVSATDGSFTIPAEVAAHIDLSLPVTIYLGLVQQQETLLRGVPTTFRTTLDVASVMFEP